AAWEVTARQLAPKGRVYLGVSARPVLTPDYFPPVVDIDIVNPALIGCHHYRLPAYHSTDGSVVLNPDGVPQAVDGGGGVIQLVARQLATEGRVDLVVPARLVVLAPDHLSK